MFLDKLSILGSTMYLNLSRMYKIQIANNIAFLSCFKNSYSLNENEFLRFCGIPGLTGRIFHRKCMSEASDDAMTEIITDPEEKKESSEAEVFANDGENVALRNFKNLKWTAGSSASTKENLHDTEFSLVRFFLLQLYLNSTKSRLYLFKLSN